ncbi:MAG: pyridoxamine 5'-phosphate oxidase family protein [Acidimicrobiales bacterium]
MIDQGLTALLERGCAMVVGTVGEDGWPHAQRAWGCSVVDATTVRVLLDGSDAVIAAHIAGGGRIAITSADVRTLHSVQLKGLVTAVVPPNDEDLDRCERHNEELFTDIELTDFYPRELSSRMVPPEYRVAVVEVDEIYDQTPGPGAGREWPAA